jgi:predicted TIM-barrel fold metal-dependent hydrolase
VPATVRRKPPPEAGKANNVPREAKPDENTLAVRRSLARFDSLVHATRDGRWLSGRHDASVARLMAELDRASVARACLVGLPGVADNDFVLECARTAGDRLVPIAGVDPGLFKGQTDIGAEIESLARQGFAGVKLHPRLNGYDPLESRCLETMAAAGEHGLAVFLDTLFRQRQRATMHPADIVDRIANGCRGAAIVLLHGGGPAVLEFAELVALHPSLTLDLSFTLLKYAGSSLDADLRWVLEHLDERVVIGSDMPEFTPSETFSRAERLAEGLPPHKWANVAHRNLDRLFAPPAALPAP